MYEKFDNKKKILNLKNSKQKNRRIRSRKIEEIRSKEIFFVGGADKLLTRRLEY